ncbi:MAG: hypothetical protein GY894_10385 [Planctomycetes bacterium]|nr:hypothetical protein [Planctomycetota bacterium]MCP4839748.1 hypothetical protein [Planctomycetota bacterium]
MKATAIDTWGFIGALLAVSVISFVLVRYVAHGPSDGAEAYMEALLDPPASAPAPVIRVVAPSVVAKAAPTSTSSASSASAANASAPTSFVDTLRSRQPGRHSYDRSQLRANQ